MSEGKNFVFMDEKPWNLSTYRLGTIAWDTAQREPPAVLAVRAEANQEHLVCHLASAFGLAKCHCVYAIARGEGREPNVHS